MNTHARSGLRRAARIAITAVLFFSCATLAAPAPQALLQNATRVPDLQERLPAPALSNSAVVGELTPGLFAASSIAITLADGRRLVAARQREVGGASGSRSWVGHFPEALGSVFVLTEHRGSISGFFQHEDALYEIAPSRSSAGRHVVYRVDESRLPPMSESPSIEVGDDEDTIGASADATATASATGTVVDVMILYTPASRVRYGQANLEARILSAVAGANQAYLNSSIDLQINVVHLAEVSYTETGNMGDALAALQGTSDGKMDEVHRWRDQYGADLVSLINEDSNICGKANTMKNVSTYFAPYAFSVVGSGCLSNLSLQHELGHNMGNQHDRDSATNLGAYEYSYGFRRCVSDGSGFRTVMAYACSGASRVNYFSNPYVTYGGYATGVAYESSASGSADNARSMRSTMPVVSAFRGAGGTSGTTTVPAAPGAAAATAVSEQRIDLRWSDQSSNESGFRIERSSNGVDWSEIAQVAANVTSYASTGLSASTVYYFRVRAWNSAGNSAYSGIASATTWAAAPPPPAAPTSVATTVASSEVTVAWTDAAYNESGFEVLRETYNSRKGTWGGATILSAPVPDLTSLADSPGSGTFRYSVRSYNSGGKSSWAGPVSVTVASSTKSKKGGGPRPR